MPDILTTLQTTYDTLIIQMFSTISYLSQRHPVVAPYPNGSDPFTATLPPDTPGPEDTISHPYPLRPVSPVSFAGAQDELAEDLVRKSAQLEQLIVRLPGRGRGEAEQETRIAELVVRVREVERERARKRREVRALVERLDVVVEGMATSVDVGIGAERASLNGNGHRNGAV